MGFIFGGGGGGSKATPPPPPAPPPNPPTYASAAAGPIRGVGPIGGLASTILTSPMGTSEPYSTSKKALLGG